MKRIFICSLILIIGLASTQLLETVYDPATKLAIGTKDLPGLNDRIEQSQESTSMNFAMNDQSSKVKNLGLTEWGVIQVAAHLTGYPDLKGVDKVGSFCEVVGEDVQSTKISEITIDKADFVYDFEIHDNVVYIMTGTANLQAVEVKPRISTVTGKAYTTSDMKVSWEVKDLMAVSNQLFGNNMQEACMAHHGNQRAVFIPTDVGLMRLDIASKNVTAVGSGVYQANQDLVYCDIVEDVLFVAFLDKGIFLYNVRDPASITKIGLMDAAYFLKQSGETLKINDFVVHNHLVEVMVTDTSVLNSKPWQRTDDSVVFSSDISLGDYTKELVDKNHNNTLMFVAEKSRIFVIDVTKILASNNMSGSLLPRMINYEDVQRLKRFDNTLVALFHLPNSKTVQSIVSEVFVLNSDPDKWRSNESKDDDLYWINSEIPFYDHVENVFVDDRHFYAILEKTHFIYERGVPSSFGIGNFKISNQFVEPDVYDMAKFNFNGHDFVVTIGSNHVANFQMVRSDPYLVCPQRYSKPPTGKYLISLNATTRSCPTKLGLASVMSEKGAMTKLCRWSTTISVDYYRETALENTSVMQTVVIVMLVALLLLLGGFSFIVYRNRQVNEEYEKLKAQIGNVQLPTHADTARSQPLENEKMNTRVKEEHPVEYDQ